MLAPPAGGNKSPVLLPAGTWLCPELPRRNARSPTPAARQSAQAWVCGRLTGRICGVPSAPPCGTPLHAAPKREPFKEGPSAPGTLHCLRGTVGTCSPQRTPGWLRSPLQPEQLLFPLTSVPWGQGGGCGSGQVQEKLLERACHSVGFIVLQVGGRAGAVSQSRHPAGLLWGCGVSRGQEGPGTGDSRPRGLKRGSPGPVAGP